ncbi:MAG: 2-oxo acid dehydrogenase subunit E2 [Asgard group archaeon]|nr:2-oxo acid dehydrogenase subunit E2 [Asgard group archaeon]
MKKDHGSYSITHFTKMRRMIQDACTMAKYYNHIYGIFEIDVTDAKSIIADHKEKTGEQLSFTAWVIKCIAQAISEYKFIQAFQWRRNTIVTFDDVDIKCMVEKDYHGHKTPIAYIVRKANEKSFMDIHNEIRQAQKFDKDQSKKEQKQKNTQQLLMSVPKTLRRGIVWRMIMTNPFRVKKNLGTCGVTSMGMYGKSIIGWAIPKTPHSTTFAIGAIIKRPVVIDDEIKIREVLHMTAEFNHDFVDGAPGVRFVAYLTELMQSAYGLEEFKEK